MFHKYEKFENTNGLSEAVNTSRHWWNLDFIEWGPLTLNQHVKIIQFYVCFAYAMF